MTTATAALHARIDTLGDQDSKKPSVILVSDNSESLGTAQLFAVDPASVAPAKRGVVLAPEVREIARPEASVLILQRWEGVVLECSPDAFTARIVDAQGSHPDEEVVIAYEEISPFDREMVADGAIFYWGVGYRQRLPNGSRERVSAIRFRRLPAWTQAEVQEQLERAQVLARDLGWE